jgi:hypothetical protein
MASTRCTDRVAGAILASWRYDISGISPEMRKDYEHHFTECPHCRGRQAFHRGLDVSLAVLTSLAVFFFLFALPRPGYFRRVPHAHVGSHGGCTVLGDRLCAGADGHAGANLSGRHRSGARAQPGRALAGENQVAAAAMSCIAFKYEGPPDGGPSYFGCRRAHFAIDTRISPPVISSGNPSARIFSSVGEISRSDPSGRSR